jgi:hypothetical protein
MFEFVKFELYNQSESQITELTGQSQKVSINGDKSFLADSVKDEKKTLVFLFLI